MLSLKSFLLFMGILFFGFAQAQTDDGILRDSQSNVVLMTGYEASGVNPATAIKDRPDACELAGKGRLPTIRELAKEAQAMGAKGILEVSEVVNPDELRRTYPQLREISALNTDSQRDEFYFIRRGYRNPKGELGNHLFWSSSVNANDFPTIFVLSGLGGDVGHDGLNFGRYAVRCFVNL